MPQRLPKFHYKGRCLLLPVYIGFLAQFAKAVRYANMRTVVFR